MKKFTYASLIFVALVLMVSCTSTGPKVGYVDPTAVETTTASFGATDLQMVAEKMVDSLLTFPPIVQMTQNRRPVMFVDNIKRGEGVLEHIDYVAITDSISTRLLKSGKFRFADRTKIDAAMNEIDFGTSGAVDPSTAASFGKMIGAEFMLYGNIASIVKRNNNMRDVYYKFTMKLMNVETGLLEWMEEKEIRKQAVRRGFGA